MFLTLHTYMSVYGVALVSRIDTIIGLFCKRDLQKRRYSAKETYNFIDPTDRSHPISDMSSYTEMHANTETDKDRERDTDLQIYRDIGPQRHWAIETSAERERERERKRGRERVTKRDYKYVMDSRPHDYYPCACQPIKSLANIIASTPFILVKSFKGAWQPRRIYTSQFQTRLHSTWQTFPSWQRSLKFWGWSLV